MPLRIADEAEYGPAWPPSRLLPLLRRLDDAQLADDNELVLALIEEIYQMINPN